MKNSRDLRWLTWTLVIPVVVVAVYRAITIVPIVVRSVLEAVR